MVQLAVSGRHIESIGSFQRQRYKLYAPAVTEMRGYAQLYRGLANMLASRVGTLTDEYDLTDVGLSADNKLARAIATEALAKKVKSLVSARALVLVAEEASNEVHREQAIERLRSMKGNAGLVEPIFK